MSRTWDEYKDIRNGKTLQQKKKKKTEIGSTITQNKIKESSGHLFMPTKIYI